MRQSISTLALAAALPALALPGVASAAEAVTGSVGGYMYMGAGFSDGAKGPSGSDGDTEFGVLRDGEVHLKATGSSDNGLTFDVQVELEMFTTSDQMDENWGRVRGSFGEVYIGAADTAINEYGGVGVVKPAGSAFNYYDGDNVTLSGAPVNFIGEFDSLAIRYGTHKLLGPIELGISYSPNGETDGANDTSYGFSSRGAGRSSEKDQWAVGGNYSEEFESFKFAVGAGYLTQDVNGGVHDDEDELFHIGAAIGFSGFTIAGLYNREELADDTDFDRWAIGAMYETGPWKVGGGLTYTDYEGDQGGALEDEQYYGTIGLTYKIMPGVNASATAEIGDDENNSTGFAGAAWLDIKF